MGMTKKIPVKEVEGTETTCETVERTLIEDKGNAYTISGLMVDAFGVKESDIYNKPFSQWKSGQPSLYTRIRLCLGTLVKEGKVKQRKKSKAMLYWWAG